MKPSRGRGRGLWATKFFSRESHAAGLVQECRCRSAGPEPRTDLDAELNRSRWVRPNSTGRAGGRGASKKGEDLVVLALFGVRAGSRVSPVHGSRR